VNDRHDKSPSATAANHQKLSDRLQKYASDNRIGSYDRIFQIAYAGIRVIVKKAGDLVGIHIHLKPHILRRHAATYANRSAMPLEIVVKFLLRHSNRSTTKKAGQNRLCRGEIVD